MVVLTYPSRLIYVKIAVSPPSGEEKHDRKNPKYSEFDIVGCFSNTGFDVAADNYPSSNSSYILKYNFDRFQRYSKY
jgi:hypothetical protein